MTKYAKLLHAARRYFALDDTHTLARDGARLDLTSAVESEIGSDLDIARDADSNGITQRIESTSSNSESDEMSISESSTESSARRLVDPEIIEISSDSESDP
jgi:hypothetical protein